MAATGNKVGFKSGLAMLALMLGAAALHGQTTLRLHVTDLAKRPLAEVQVVSDNSSGFTDRSGNAFLKYAAGSVLRLHKFGFADTALTLPLSPARDTLHLAVALRVRMITIPEIAVSPGSIEEINPLKADFITGFDLQGRYLVELLTDDNVVVIDLENNTSSRSKPVKDARELARDARGQLYVLTERSAHKVFAGVNGMVADPSPVNRDVLGWYLKYCDDAHDTCSYIRRYKDNNQTVGFFAVSDVHANCSSLLKEMGDAERRNAVAAFAQETNSFNQYLASRGLNKVTAENLAELEMVNGALENTAFMENAYVQPSYAALKIVNDSLHLFAHDIDSLFVYTAQRKLVRAKRINYHRLKSWDRELIVNEEGTKVYARLRVGTRPALAEVDLFSGELSSPYVTLKARFPRNIRIRNDVIYYMDKQKGGTGSTVYAQRLH